MPMDLPAALTRAAIPATSSSGRPCSAAAPAIFSTMTVTPTPRRPAVKRESSTATSSLVTTLATWMPDSASTISAAISKFMTSPV